tara:strand:+ start:90 stop:647 length:558 start_codon:yes stop_codon:yes gene_type:complete
MKKLTEEEIFVRKELENEYSQLVTNSRNVCGSVYKKHGHDLLAMCIEIYLLKPIEYQLKVISDGKLVNFITHIMNFQLKLDTTKYYYHYKKFDIKQRELYPAFGYKGANKTFATPFQDEEDPIVTCLKKSSEKLNVFEKMILNRHLINGEKFKDLSEEFDIPYHQFKITAKKIKTKLKDSCIHFL